MGVSMLPFENADFAHVVFGRGNAAGLMSSPNPEASPSLKVTTGTQVESERNLLAGEGLRELFRNTRLTSGDVSPNIAEGVS